MAKQGKTPIHPTKNTLNENLRRSMIELLQVHLASAIDLSYQAKQAHWNVKGHNFYGTHLLFDKLHEEAEEYVDTIAERLTALGGQARGTVQASAEATVLDPYPLDLVDLMGHIKRLADSYAKWGGALKDAVKESDEAGDDLTADLFTEVGRGIDKSLYFLESHFQHA
ncbi:DNA starvation/stationary phase protection protein Dps [Aureimonas phyllosphaerae]|uniref:Starvation-inducible DNA-binding protein n=1 Tax=Aureimonas phyllosphaerae TaxID=1166078 RepID=A0A7W6FSK0_9HYPH|nr:DNA starvation/stationary phase protection protein Dps [Aureimonas phyllosphaerae]MBB3934068.1 starvation-inducible DNA-binding protein [Aureimonas phyllosphaerae]MBB3958716.1 starvation-inducible DNA-binding protein [Aureimonas phyllosphaerae]SFF18350.1 starvation-inducible DNA-binding protein [Aureimonas phyllosphaerae]